MRTIAPRCVLATLATVIVTFGTSACVSTPTPQEQQRTAMQPVGTPSPAAGPIADPRGSREISGKGFRIAANAAFQQSEHVSKNGEPMLVLTRASKVPELPIQVAVLREPHPTQDVIEQSYTLEVAKRTLGQASDISRSTVVWPDATASVLVQWSENVPTQHGGAVPTRYWQLNTQVSKDLILIVVAFAPAAEFDKSGAGEAVRTFRVGS